MSARCCWYCGHPVLSQFQQDSMSALVAEPTRTNAELAEVLGRPEQSIKNRLSELYAVLGVSGRIDLLLLTSALKADFEKPRAQRRRA